MAKKKDKKKDKKKKKGKKKRQEEVRPSLDDGAPAGRRESDLPAGAAGSRTAPRDTGGAAIRREIGDFVSRLAVLPWDEAAAEHYGDIRAALERRGKPLGAMDLLIAAHARSRGATLVSNDVRHFRRVKGLLVANWV